MSPEFHELVIIGGGGLGSVLAYLSVDQGFTQDVVLFDAPARLNLGSDTHRNHAWMQSGLLYATKDRTAAEKMFASGKALRELGHLRRIGAPGIFRIEEARESEFRSRAELLNLTNSIRRLTDRQAKTALDVFYSEAFAYFEVPDTLFEEARIVHTIAKRAEGAGVSFRRQSVSLVADNSSPTGYAIQTDSGTIYASFTVLCAGAGLLHLLKQLGLESPFAVFRSALIVCESDTVIQTPLFVDVSEGLPTSGLAVGYHVPQTSHSQGRYVIGSRFRTSITVDQIPHRTVPRNESSQIENQLPDNFKAGSSKMRVTAGYKTEYLIDGKPTVNSRVQDFSERYRGLLAAVPGKATLSYSAAMEVIAKLRLLKQSLHVVSRKPPQAAPSGAAGAAVAAEPKMHHDPVFDGLLDEAE